VLKVRTIATGQVVGKPVAGVRLHDLAFTPDGAEILAVTEGVLGQRWRTATGERADAGWAAEFGKARLLTITNRIITTDPLRLWDLSARKTIATLRSDGDVTIAVSSDQQKFATADRAGVRTWRSATGAQIGLTVSAGAEVSVLSFLRTADGSPSHATTTPCVSSIPKRESPSARPWRMANWPASWRLSRTAAAC